jgi:DNA polymerase-3 subunit epsilon
MHPGQRNSLDALCKRYGVKNTHREFHGALKDAELLAQVYLAMTGGQTNLKLSLDDQRKDTNNLKAQENNNSESFNIPSFKKIERPEGFKLKIVRASAEELKAHEDLS